MPAPAKSHCHGRHYTQGRFHSCRVGLAPATLGCVMPSGLCAFSFPVLCVCVRPPQHLIEVQLPPMLHNFPSSRPKANLSLLCDGVGGCYPVLFPLLPLSPRQLGTCSPPLPGGLETAHTTSAGETCKWRGEAQPTSPSPLSARRTIPSPAAIPRTQRPLSHPYEEPTLWLG